MAERLFRRAGGRCPGGGWGLLHGLARQLFRGPCEGALHPSQVEALADSLATWPLQWMDRTMRQYSDRERSSAAASRARSCHRLGGTRSFSSSVFLSASGGMAETSERKDRPEPGGNSGRLETAPAGRRRRAVGGDGMDGHDSTHCTTWRAIHRAHQAAAMEMVTGEIMRLSESKRPVLEAPQGAVQGPSLASCVHPGAVH